MRVLVAYNFYSYLGFQSNVDKALNYPLNHAPALLGISHFLQHSHCSNFLLKGMMLISHKDLPLSFSMRGKGSRESMISVQSMLLLQKRYHLQWIFRKGQFSSWSPHFPLKTKLPVLHQK